jgi:hypothetical protein
MLLLALAGLCLAGETNDTTEETAERLDRRIHTELADAQVAAPFGENVPPSFRQFIKEQLPPPPPPAIPVPPAVEEVTTNTVSTTTETTVEQEVLEPELPIALPPPPHFHHHHRPHHHHHHHCDFRHQRDCPPDCHFDCAPHCPPHCPPDCIRCLTDRAAHRLASTWLYFSINLNKRLALDTLAEDFIFLSDSENMAGNGPLGVGLPFLFL